MKGLIHIYCGDGKGKTTAALGLAIRCSGSGKKVLLCRFLKDDKSSETAVLKTIKNIEIAKCPSEMKFSFAMTPDEKKQLSSFYTKELAELKERAKEFDMIILDEVLHAVNKDFLPLDKLIGFLDERPAGVEIVMTGRDPKKELCERADYITEMKKIKHPFDKGITARIGIEK